MVPVAVDGRQVGTVEFGLAFGADFVRRFSERTGLKAVITNDVEPTLVRDFLARKLNDARA